MEYIFKVMDIVMQYLQSIRVTDLVDMAIIAFVVYQLIMFARRSNLWGVVKGLLVFAAAIALAEKFQLNAISFLLNRLVNVGIVALVVVFQPEIRHWLERIGGGITTSSLLVLRTPESSQLKEAIDQTVEAYASLSRDKTGALMVFERHNSLQDVAKSGTLLDCDVNSELIKNLFWNKAPLHDGAVIVRDGRIIGAGCMLPMSKNTNLSKDIGMRHRAAVGMSESTDAVVAIVSEETGGISVAVGGMLKRHLSPETLQRLLMKELMPEHEAQTSRSILLRLWRALGGRKEEDHG